MDEPHDGAHTRVIRFLAETLRRDAGSIRLDERLATLDVDSLLVVEFFVELEDELGIEIPDRGLKTVGDLIQHVREATAEA